MAADTFTTQLFTPEEAQKEWLWAAARQEWI